MAKVTKPKFTQYNEFSDDHLREYIDYAIDINFNVKSTKFKYELEEAKDLIELDIQPSEYENFGELEQVIVEEFIKTDEYFDCKLEWGKPKHFPDLINENDDIDDENEDDEIDFNEYDEVEGFNFENDFNPRSKNRK